jgi:uncharacterized Zn finger protein (UPF0148 family)
MDQAEQVRGSAVPTTNKQAPTNKKRKTLDKFKSSAKYGNEGIDSSISENDPEICGELEKCESGSSSPSLPKKKSKNKEANDTDSPTSEIDREICEELETELEEYESRSFSPSLSKKKSKNKEAKHKGTKKETIKKKKQKSGGLPVHNERGCEQPKCKNGGYFHYNGTIYCGVHSRKFKDEREPLKKDPKKLKKIQQELNEKHMKEVERHQRENKTKSKMGVVLTTKLLPRKQKSPLISGYMQIFPNNWHSKIGHFSCSELSPMKLHALDHKEKIWREPDGQVVDSTVKSNDAVLEPLPPAKSIENFHQFSKVFDCETKKDSKIPKQEYWKTKIDGWKDKNPHRHKPCVVEAKNGGKENKNEKKTKRKRKQKENDSTEEDDNSETEKKKGKKKQKKVIPQMLCSLRSDSQGRWHYYTYVQSRWFYCYMYEKRAKESPKFQELLKMVQDGRNLEIVGYDAYRITKSLDEHYEDPNKPFGHEMVLMCLLTIPESKDLPWHRYAEKNKEIYEAFK